MHRWLRRVDSCQRFERRIKELQRIQRETKTKINFRYLVELDHYIVSAFSIAVLTEPSLLR